jgi:hypothetical protein
MLYIPKYSYNCIVSRSIYSEFLTLKRSLWWNLCKWRITNFAVALSMFNCSYLCFFSTYNKEKYIKRIAILHSIARSSLGKLRNNLSLLWQFSWSESVRPNSDAKFLVNVTVYSFWKTNLLWQFSWFKNIAARALLCIVRGRPFNFWGGGVILKRNFLQGYPKKTLGTRMGYSEQKKYLH